MIERLPRFAETTIQRLCADAGALCHKVDEDESGWDFLVELPAKPFAGPAESAPPNSVAYVQVKSTKTQRLTCRVKLSNALRAAQSPQPWFIAFVVVRENAKTIKVYAAHFGEDLIRRTLEAVRQAEVEGRALNRASLVVRFEPSDLRPGDLVAWMQQSIDGVTAPYDATKRALYETVGYETGYGEGKLTVEASTEEEIINNFLGLGDGLKITQFTFVPHRFGIPGRTPQVDMSEGIVRITPCSAGDVEFHLRSHTSAQALVIPGKAYVFNPPADDDSTRRVRFSAGFFDIIVKVDRSIDFTMNYDHLRQHDLLTLENHATMNAWLLAGQIDVQIWRDGKRNFGGMLQVAPEKLSPAWKVAALVTRVLRSVAGTNNRQVITSLRNISTARGSKTFADIADAPSFRCEFNPTPDAPAKVTHVLYWLQLEVAEYLFCLLVERPVRDDAIINGKRVITAGKGRWLENFVLTNPSLSDRQMIQRDYEHHFAMLEDSGTPLGVGDLLEFIAAAAVQRSADESAS